MGGAGGCAALARGLNRRAGTRCKNIRCTPWWVGRKRYHAAQPHVRGILLSCGRLHKVLDRRKILLHPHQHQVVVARAGNELQVLLLRGACLM